MPYIGKQPAAVPVTADDIPDNSITAAKIVDGAITIADIADDAVTADKLANSINTEIAANTAKTGITTAQASAITANTAKTGITSGQASAITANTAKTGITTAQADAITANTAKTGITSGQASAITANTAKVTNSTSATDLTSGTLPTARLPAGSVLQVVSFQHGTSQSITGTSDTTLTDWDFTITKKQNNSRIYCSMQFYMYYSSSPTYWWIKAYANSSYVTSNSSWKNDVATNNAQQYTLNTSAHQQYNAQFYDDTNASSVQFTFKVNQNASGSLTSWSAGTGNTYFFTEVAV